MSPDIRNDPRLIAQWAERYARSRTIPFLVQWVFIVVLVSIVGALAFFTLRAFQTQHRTLVWIGIAALALTNLLLVWFSVAKWGGEQIWRISQWLYGKEGWAVYGQGKVDKRTRRPWWFVTLALGLCLYHLVGAFLIGMRRLPVEYIQPLSALYLAPFLAVMIVTQRLGWWAWVWPALYAAYAVALVAGAPLHFHGQWFAFDVLVPIFGGGLIAILVGHFYSRYALRRLKALVRAGMEEEDRSKGDEVE
ncbi:MAG TPA: hypothetical protein P5318_01680 [Candidatus Hydrogenedentes bacterium]|nr:hypothetical protein [Candidatus Hydrogenedentota bacterium]HRT18810.1 hypothetical protein [Candidatus Hydrogenedentota bacterium]HRT65745.1 hypothetical protein [Candidatus Hydrogenedentota bacterium]